MRFEDLMSGTRSERAALLSVPIIQDCLAGRVTRSQYLAFLGEAYHHVSHTVPLLVSCARGVEGHPSQWLRAALVEYIEEEEGHEEWILDDIAACGGDPDAVRDGAPGPATELMVAYVFDYIVRKHPAGFLGMVHVLEGTSAALATAAADSMRMALGLPPAAFTYLTSHGSLDQQHVQFFQGLVERLDEEEGRHVMHVARMVYRLYADIFRALPS